MLKNYLKVALRNLFRHKLYTFINVAGLAVGIAFCLLIILFVQHEWSYDRFHPNAQRMYRVALKEITPDKTEYFNTVTPIVFAPMLKQNLAEVEQVVRVCTRSNLVKRNEVSFSETIHIVDTNFFHLFNFPLIKGPKNTALRNPNSVVLTEESAIKYFGKEDPIGKTLTIRLRDTDIDFTVSAVAKNAPSHSSIQFDYLISFENAKHIWHERALKAFFQVFVETYIQLPDEAALTNLQAKLPAVLKQNLGEDYTPGGYNLLFQPITDIHLNKDFPEGIEPISDPAYSYILATVAVLVLLIASINFITLSLGRSVSRAREVGIRKVVGAERKQLITQFWGEAILISLLSLITGIMLATFSLPVFNDLAGQTLTYNLVSEITLFSLILSMIVGLLAGMYPAIFLSRFNPIEVLKGHLKVSDAGIFRQGLIVFQFVLSISLIICTLIMSQQLRYLQNKNLGFDKEQVIVIPTGADETDALAIYERMKNELATHQSIAGITNAMFTLGEGWAEADYHDNTNTVRAMAINVVDHDFQKIMKTKMVAGRDFSKDISADISEAIIVNEALVKEYGWKNPIGERLPGKDFPPHQIIGVVKDFNYQSLHTPVKPLVMALSDSIFQGTENVNFSSSSRRKILVRIKPENIQTTIALLEQTWKKAAPSLPYTFSFMDETLNKQYQAEIRLSNMMNYATGFAVFIACLGLFSLATLAVQKRQREIGVRKVMGASVKSIVVLFSREFAKLVIIAFVVAAPLAYFIMHSWLQDFAYRIPISVWIYLLAGILSLVIALLTVSYQVIRAALANPVNALRSE
ncbi:FtsX-like permease family protein [Rhodocytophaga rosea]|uniref:FtsX-like permease family protein n=1 Tax=Rhodocytophaga rosea TaxID=2704465 RepID=A0A6C0GIU2_9BACT|nr:ABC transporter permease [Rhodocytophaga rosea]QHT67981.1 FtsX-like permease family protein [Rhodocytophaga rosea]